jgi:glucan phosphoethanolaminetransferase (alkaline phosphatase superfamily)
MSLVDVILSVSIELKWTMYLTKDTQTIINFTHRASKPNLIIIFSKNPYSTLSFALCISSLNARGPCFPLFVFIAWIHSYAIRILTVIKRPSAIGTLHQNDFDAITLLHLSILMQETKMVDAIAILALVIANRCKRLLHQDLLHRLASNAKLMW